MHAFNGQSYDDDDRTIMQGALQGHYYLNNPITTLDCDIIVRLPAKNSGLILDGFLAPFSPALY